MITRKYLNGFKNVSHWITAGILTIGNTRPLSIKKGRIKKKVVIMACCWVLEIAEMKSPMPSVLIRKRNTPVNNIKRLPLKGISNQYRANEMTAIIWTRDIRA